MLPTLSFTTNVGAGSLGNVLAEKADELGYPEPGRVKQFQKRHQPDP